MNRIKRETLKEDFGYIAGVGFFTVLSVAIVWNIYIKYPVNPPFWGKVFAMAFGKTAAVLMVALGYLIVKTIMDLFSDHTL